VGTVRALRNQPSDYPRLAWVISIFFREVYTLVIKTFTGPVLSVLTCMKNNSDVFTKILDWQELLTIRILFGIGVFLLPIAYASAKTMQNLVEIES